MYKPLLTYVMKSP